LTDAAQGEPSNHEVFTKPFKVEAVFEEWNTPQSYRRGPGGAKLPDKLKVWRVQNTSPQPATRSNPASAISRPLGPSHLPKAEVLTPGFNTSNRNGAAGAARDGNFLQWGFSAPPSKMTDAGRNFFLNCVCYIAKVK